MRGPGSEGTTGEGMSDAAATDADVTEEVEPAGRFRIYLGAAPGVGKTYAMLSEGRRRRARGADVVAGFVEAYGRPATEELIDGLEVIPRKVVDYRGQRLEEMDLDAILRRRPEVALVDELAHTNVPGGSRHDKRWQDVLDILGAGISVITTVNIQHLESIAHEVEQMTGAKVTERVPDWVVRKADQIELIDSSPQQLRRRMLHGNIYPKPKIAQTLTHFSAPTTSSPCGSWRCGSLLTNRTRHSSSTSSGTSLRSRGTRPSASWQPSPPSRGPTSCYGAQRASHSGSRRNST
jgi:K+-sensing histidine kinase KdpD